MSRAQALLAGAQPRWDALTTHPFVLATAEGTLSEATFDNWLLDDHVFVVQFRRFLAGVLLAAPDEPTRDVLAGGIVALTPELALFRTQLDGRGLDPSRHEPSLTCAGYCGWFLASLHDGYDVALVVLHGIERAYLDAWTAVRERSTGQRYAQFVHNWSSPEFGSWVDALAELLGDGEPTPAQARAQTEVTEWEHRFWDTVHRGHSGSVTVGDN